MPFRLSSFGARLSSGALISFAVVCIACGGGGNGAPGGMPPGGAMPPTPVEIVTLVPRNLPQTSEFIGTVKSRRSTNIQPQAEGFLTRILVKSGDRVSAGSRLMEIDSKPQEAAIASQEAVKAQREIDVTYARQEADRAKRLLAAGASSQMDADRAINALNAAEAQVKIVDEQIRQLRTDLAYYHVTSPTAGVVGDIPVREGDRVTKSTFLTTVDANEGLELYLNIPVQQAPLLKAGMPVRLMDERGEVAATTAINFVAPSVDTATQTVLAKVPLGSSSGYRTSQFVRAQVVWSNNPTLSVPVTSVTRINGQYFVFVAEPAGSAPAGAAAAPPSAGSAPAPGGSGLVAHQRAVQLGAVLGNDYLVTSGLVEGEKLIVTGIQKIGDGAPVQAAPPPSSSSSPGPAAPGQPASPAEGRK